MRGLHGLLVVAGMLISLTGCENSSGDQDDIILTVKERHEAELMIIPGVVGVGIGEVNGTETIIVYVEKKTPLVDREVPKELKGYPVVVEVTGPIVALGIPAEAPYIEGRITALENNQILVEANPAETSGSAKASLRLTDSSRILRHSGAVARPSDLRVRQRLRVWVVGPVMESYPAQAVAAVIVIEP